MQSIWKYPVPITGEFTIMMPRGAVPIAVQIQHGAPRLWARVDTDAPLEQHAFRLVGTGHVTNNADLWGTYIGTFQLAPDALVFHLFDEGERCEDRGS